MDKTAKLEFIDALNEQFSLDITDNDIHDSDIEKLIEDKANVMSNIGNLMDKGMTADGIRKMFIHGAWIMTEENSWTEERLKTRIGEDYIRIINEESSYRELADHFVSLF